MDRRTCERSCTTKGTGLSGMNNINLSILQKFKTQRNDEPAYDVRKIGVDIGGGRFELIGFDDTGVDYFDGLSDHGIWSIGQENKAPGRIIASLRSEFYQNPDFYCLWLR